MTEPIKVNCYRVITTFAVAEEVWWVMEDGRVVIIVKPKDTTLVNSEKGWYSIIKPERISATIIVKEATHLIMMNSTGDITIIKRKLDKNDSTNKKNDTKI